MGRIPDELVGFLRKGQNALVIKGGPGTGKTILSLELLRLFSKEMTGVYLGTRVSAERMLAQHPWLKGVVDTQHLLTSEAPSKGRMSIADTRFEGSPLEHLFEVAMETNDPFIVVDSWEVLTRRLAEEERDKALEVLETLLSSRNANLVFVSETTGTTPLDYQADGIVALGHETLQGRRLRVMELRKLRGTRLPQAEHLFSLENGRFRHLPPFTFRPSGGRSRWKPNPDSDTHFSTGSVDLDRLLGGGYPRGSTVLIDIGPDVPRMGQGITGIILAANFLSQGRGVLTVASETWETGETMHMMSALVGQQVERLNRFLTTEEPSEQRPYIVPLEGEDVESDIEVWRKTYDALVAETGQPVLAFTPLGTQVDRYGEEAYIRAVGLSAGFMRRSGGLEIRFTVPGIEDVSRKAAQLADVHLRIECRFGSCYLYGVKPFTAIHGLDVKFSKGVPRLDLTPIV